MDKQFARILMLGVLLPAGAALAEAIQHENMIFSARNQAVMPEWAGVTQAELARKAAATPDRQTRHTAARGSDESREARKTR